MKLHPSVFVLCACLGFGSGAALAQKPKPLAAFEGRVVRVVDGESLVVRLADKTEHAVRLRHIDAPEPCQAGGAEATQSLVDLALGQNVKVGSITRSPDGSLLGAVTLNDADLSRRQVEEGHAWSLRFRHDTGPLVKEERMARALRRGFHAAGTPEMPKDFRQRNGPCR